MPRPIQKMKVLWAYLEARASGANGFDATMLALMDLDPPSPLEFVQTNVLLAQLLPEVL